MNVLVISNVYPSHSHHRGIFVKAQVDDLRNVSKVKIVTVVRKRLYAWAYFPFLLKHIIFLLFKKYDLVHAHYGFHSALVAAIVKRRPLLITFHGSDALIEPLRNRLYSRLQRFVVSRSDHIIAVSSEVRNVLISQLHAEPAKISIISCGVDTSVFSPIDKIDVRRKLKIDEGEKVVLFIGQLRYGKGVDIISECARRMPDVTFLLIGTGPLRINTKNCRSVGIYPNIQIPTWINAADIFILPSRSEGTPVVLLEALSCGIPVVASKVGGIPDVVREGETGYLVEPEDVDMFEKRLRELLENPEKRRKMGQQGRKDMIENYDSRKIANRIKMIYEKVIVTYQLAGPEINSLT